VGKRTDCVLVILAVVVGLALVAVQAKATWETIARLPG